MIIGALVVGIAIAWVDSRPGWDDTAVSVAALVVASFGFAAVSGRRPWLWALLVGVWTPLVEIGSTGQLASLAALAFSAIGAALGYVSARATSAAHR